MTRRCTLGRTYVAAASLGLALAGCGGGGSSAVPSQGASGAAPQTLAVTVAPVEERTVQRTVETTGSLLASEEVVLNTSVSGTVVRLRADLGDLVQAGQVVAELDTREFALAVDQAEAALRKARNGLLRAQAQAEASRASLQQARESRKSWEAKLNGARAALEEARLNLERTQTLLADRLIAQREFDAARTRFESALAQYQTAEVELQQHPDRVRVAEAQLESDLSAGQVAEAEIGQQEAALGIARKKLADATLRAPIRGAIARRHVNPGEFLKDNTPVFTIVRSDPLKYTGTVPERAALDLRPGQTVRLEVDPAPGRTFEGRVIRVSPAVDVTNRTVALEAEIPNPQGRLKPGLFARGVVEIRKDSGVAFVPEAAVSSFVGITKVFVVSDGKAHERRVKVGGRQDGAVETLEGVRPGEQVATSALAQLYDGAPVSVAAPRVK